MYNLIKLNEKDNVAVAPMNIPNNTKVEKELVSRAQIPFGHKTLTKNAKRSKDCKRNWTPYTPTAPRLQRILTDATLIIKGMC